MTTPLATPLAEGPAPFSKKGSGLGGVTDLLECSVCLEPLGLDHKVLPCQHTFCLPCLQDISRKRGGAGGVFLCPECRNEVTVPISSLPSNVILNRILSGLELEQLQLQKEGGGSPAPLVKRAPPPPLAIGEHRRLPLPSPPKSENNNIPGNWATNPFLAATASTPPTSPVPVLPPKTTHTAPPPLPARPNPAPHQVFRALYDYKPVKPDELALKKDEVYFVIEKCQDGWYKGSSLTSLKTGVFPGNYVQHVQHEKNKTAGTEQQQQKQQQQTGSDLIDFSADIMACFGTNKQIVPPNKTLPLSDDTKQQQQEEQQQKSKQQQQQQQQKLLLYRATMPFPSSSQFELELKQNDVIIMNKIRQDGWCKGTLQRTGQTGLFPLSFVEKIK
jgi:hypothetical protein